MWLCSVNNKQYVYEVEMKLFATTLCIVGTALALSACGSTYNSGASYATDRTAGHANATKAPAPAAEKVFKEMQVK